MTLSQIMALALRQLDEDAQDISEYDEAFRVYASIGYGIAVREFLKPMEWFSLTTDERGEAEGEGAGDGHGEYLRSGVGSIRHKRKRTNGCRRRDERQANSAPGT